MEWISVEDKLPKRGECVIALTNELYMIILKPSGFLSVSEWAVYSGDGKNHSYKGYDVTHWMPLPEPPQN